MREPQLYYVPCTTNITYLVDNFWKQIYHIPLHFIPTQYVSLLVPPAINAKGVQTTSIAISNTLQT